MCIVRRRYLADSQHPLPGLKPWMHKQHLQDRAAEHRRLQEIHEREHKIERDALLLELERKAPVLDPEDWREKRMRRMHFMDFLERAIDPDPTDDRLHPEYLVIEADRAAFRARVREMREELAGMIERLRIVPAESAPIPTGVERQVGQLLRRLTEVKP